jgi:hypothetical protein
LFETILGFAETSKVYNFCTYRNSQGKINGWAKFHKLMEHDPCAPEKIYKIGTLGTKNCVSCDQIRAIRGMIRHLLLLMGRRILRIIFHLSLKDDSTLIVDVDRAFCFGADSFMI